MMLVGTVERWLCFKGMECIRFKEKEMSILLTVCKVPGYRVGFPIAASFVWPENLARKALNLIIIKTIIWYFNFIEHFD